MNNESIKALKQLKYLLGWENMWVARDYLNDICIYGVKPTRGAIDKEENTCWFIPPDESKYLDIPTFPHSLDFIQYADKEPFEVI